jgi:hypothetical protein
VDAVLLADISPLFRFKARVQGIMTVPLLAMLPKPARYVDKFSIQVWQRISYHILLGVFSCGLYDSFRRKHR